MPVAEAVQINEPNALSTGIINTSAIIFTKIQTYHK